MLVGDFNHGGGILLLAPALGYAEPFEEVLVVVLPRSHPTLAAHSAHKLHTKILVCFFVCNLYVVLIFNRIKI
jgi:hypothetical protein